MNVILTSRTSVISVAICVILSSLNNVSCKNTTKPTVTDPLQRVMARFNLYQVLVDMDYKEGLMNDFLG